MLKCLTLIFPNAMMYYVLSFLAGFSIGLFCGWKVFGYVAKRMAQALIITKGPNYERRK